MATGVVIVGLGAGDPGQITVEAWRVLTHASEVYLRTTRHPTVAALRQAARYRSFDYLYETCENLADVYERIAETVVDLARRPEGVIYAVPGHPLMGEASSARILELAAESQLPVRVIAGLSFLEPVTTALRVDPFDGLQICDATLLAQRHHPNLDPDVAALIVQVCNRHVASEVKMTLLNLYHDEHPVRLVRGASTPEAEVRDLPLYALDRQEDLDHLTSVYIPPLASLGSLASYQDIVARLRAPGGCPWDRQQTHGSLRSHLLEETYEVLAALDADDMEALKEELGDLILQVLLHAQIATENGDFQLADAVGHSIQKLIRRHPHVFGEVSVEGTADVLHNWERIKREEKAGRFTSLLQGIPPALPALLQAMEMQRRAARVGFDWPEPEPVMKKVVEEIEEWHRAPDAEGRASEFGDLLFSLVNLARWHGVDPESSLREANQRFARRFESLERRAAEDGLGLEEMTLEAMDALWEQAKREERGLSQ